MIRFVKQDFDRLSSYIDDYSISSDLGAKVRHELLKRLHKNSLAALQVWAIFENYSLNEKLIISNKNIKNDSLEFAMIGECFSDLLSALQACIHGLYKPAHMSLRSGVETFVRGLAGISSEEAKSTTSVYRLFEISADELIFKGKSKEHFNKLNAQYGELCLFTHSATPAHMVKNFALANFPKHDTNQMRSFVRYFETIINSILSILIISNRDLYLKIPPVAREVLDEIISSPVKLHALGGEHATK